MLKTHPGSVNGFFNNFRSNKLELLAGSVILYLPMETTAKRILTGDRPTGRLHLGHYVGSISNRVRLQDEYECFFIIADLHTLTTKPEKEHIAELTENVRQMVLDYLACGIDPAKSTIYLQSAVPEVTELNLFFNDLVTVPRLQRIPSIKDMAKNANLRNCHGLWPIRYFRRPTFSFPLTSCSGR